MPIYAYKCDSCGFAKDVLQKMSDAPLAVCPSCNQTTFTKQVTAAGFQLKGSGWYVTDFKGGSAPATTVAPATPEASAAADSAAPKAETAAAPAPAAPATPAAPAATGS